MNLIKGTKAESNHQTEWNPEKESILMEEIHRSRMQTIEEIYFPSMQQPRGLDNITHESHAADEEIQSNKDSESDSIRKEEYH